MVELPPSQNMSEETIMNLHREASGKEVLAAKKDAGTKAETAAAKPAEASLEERAFNHAGERKTDDTVSSDEKIIIRKLPLKQCREYDLYPGYTMRVDRAIYTRFDEEGLCDVRRRFIYDLYHEEKRMDTLTVELTSGGDLEDRLILWLFMKRLSATHGFKFEERLDTVMRTIPPWERSEPVRDIKIIDLDDMRFSLNENGFAKRFEEECKGWLIFDTASEKWYAWNTTHWEPALERLGKAQRFVADSLKFESLLWHQELAVEGEKAQATNNYTRLKELKGVVSLLDYQCVQINRKHGLDSMVKIAASSTMCVNLDEVGNSEILTFKNGGIDCKTGRFFDVSELSYIRDTYPVHYVDRFYTKDASPIHFEEHLRALFTDNTTEDLSDDEREVRADELCRYFKRLLGYALCAGNPRNLFVFLWGTGANGKSTTVEAIRSAIPSEFAEGSSMELLAAREEKPLPSLFNGVRCRVIYFAEISDSKDAKGPKISREAVKNLSGDKRINLRTLYGKPDLKQILCLPIAATNDLPSFDKELDKALLRRIITIPFMHEFVGSDKRLDMADILANEADAIFSLMVDELRAYAEAEVCCPNSGLPELPEFCRTVQGRLLSDDAHYAFVDEEFEPSDGSVSGRVYVDDAKMLFISWCDVRGIAVQTKLVTSRVKDPKTGEYYPQRELSKAEARKLNAAFTTHGYELKSSSGKRYFCCRRKRV